MFMRYKKLLFFFAILLFPLLGITTEHKSPILTTTAIIEVYEGTQFKGVVLIERGKAPFGKAIPGGRVEYAETVEQAVRREMLEEVHLELSDLKQFYVYSDPTRDFRHHSVEVVHIAKAHGAPIPGDDAAKAFVVKLEEIPWEELAFDHAQILKDYLVWKLKEFENKFETLAKAEKWDEIVLLGGSALEAAKQLDKPQEEAKICARLTSTCFYQGNYTQALEYAKRSHELCEAFEEPTLFLRALYLESAVYRALAGKNSEEDLEQSLFAQAVKVAEKAAQLFLKNGVNDPGLKGKIYFNLGAAHADNPKGDLDTAVNCYLIALACYQDKGATHDLCRTNIRLGKVYLLQKNYAACQEIIDKTRPHITSKRITMQVHYLDAQLKYALKDYSAAQLLIEEGLKLAEMLGAKEDHSRFCSLSQMISKEFLSWKISELIEHAEQIPGLTQEEFSGLRKSVSAVWNQLFKEGVLEVQGADKEVRPSFVALQAVIEHVLSTELKQQIQSLQGFIHTPMPATPLCTKVPLTSELVDPCISNDSFRLLTVKARATIVRDYLSQGATLYILYPESGLFKRTAEQQQIYKQELLNYPSQLFDIPLHVDTIPNNLIGATYFFKDRLGKLFVFAIRMTQANHPQEMGDFGLWFGSLEQAAIYERVNSLADFFQENGFFEHQQSMR
jgi:8-oxo-dGTP diphosphatase